MQQSLITIDMFYSINNRVSLHLGYCFFHMKDSLCVSPTKFYLDYIPKGYVVSRGCIPSAERNITFQMFKHQKENSFKSSIRTAAFFVKKCFVANVHRLFRKRGNNSGINLSEIFVY